MAMTAEEIEEQVYLTADDINGVQLSEPFEEDYAVLGDMDFYDALPTVKEGEVLYGMVQRSVYERIVKEYGASVEVSAMKYADLRAALSPDVSEITLHRAASRETLKVLLEERDTLLEALLLAAAQSQESK